MSLDGDVKSGGRFVGDEDLRVAGESHGDHDALTHAARELMGVIVEAGRGVGDTDEVEEVGGAGAGVGARHALVEL